MLGKLEDDLTNGLVYLLQASRDMKTEFVRFLGRKAKADLKIQLDPRKVIIEKQKAISQSSRSKNVPDITIKLQEVKYWFVIENKLDSEPKLKQLENYRKQLLHNRQAGTIVCISRADPSKCVKKSITHISWKEIYDLIDKAEIEEEISTLRKDFLHYMKSLGAS